MPTKYLLCTLRSLFEEIKAAAAVRRAQKRSTHIKTKKERKRSLNEKKDEEKKQNYT